MTSIKDLGPGTNDQHRIMWSKIHPLSMASAVPTVRYRNYPSQGTGLFPTKDQQAQFQGLDPQPRMASRRRLASMYPGQSPLFGPQSRDRYGLCTRYIGMHVPSRSTPEAEAIRPRSRALCMHSTYTPKALGSCQLFGAAASHSLGKVTLHVQMRWADAH